VTLIRPQYEEFSESLPLDCGRELGHYRICYETYGRLANDRSNALLLCHGMSTDAHAMGRRTSDEPKPGWWDSAVGPGKMLDTNKYFIICSNVIGGAGGSTGPGSVELATGWPYGMRFPIVTIPDMVRAQTRLIDRLGIDRLHGVIGGCFGGHQAMQWGAAHGERVGKVVAITVRSAASAYTLALWEIVRASIRNDPAWRGGNYYGHARPVVGTGLATAISLLQWMDSDFMQARYGRDRVRGPGPQYDFEPEYSIQRMMARVIEADHATVDANTFLYLTRAADYFDLAAGQANLIDGLRRAGGDYLLVSYERDARYPVAETERLAEALRLVGRSVKHLVLSSALSHGAYLYDIAGLDREVSAFLRHE
jgi:homoserine O-acetyltransferase